MLAKLGEGSYSLVGMSNILSYQQFIPALPINYLSDSGVLVGSYKTDELLVDGIKYPRAYATVGEWFANASLDSKADIEAFTAKHGLLRWGFTHEGLGGGPSDAFYMPLRAFQDSRREFQKYWGMAEDRPHVVAKWLNQQFAPESNIAEVQDPDERYKLCQPKIGVVVTSGSKRMPGLIVRLTLGDLWQALCHDLLEVIAEKEGHLRICQEKEHCREKPYFATTDKRKIFCSHECAKRYSNRIDMRRKRARLRWKKLSQKRKGK
jgi:hypothetical protein